MKTLKTYLNKKDILSLQDLSSEEILLILKVARRLKKEYMQWKVKSSAKRKSSCNDFSKTFDQN